MSDKLLESFFPRDLEGEETLHLETQDGFSYTLAVSNRDNGIFWVRSDDPRIPSEARCIILGTDEGAIVVNHDLTLIISSPLTRVRIRPIMAITKSGSPRHVGRTGRARSHPRRRIRPSGSRPNGAIADNTRW